MQKAGLVIIGRNESRQLPHCLRSAIGTVDHIVYVDSGSTDASITIARSLGINTVELDVSLPFTAARARNSGFNYLIEKEPQIRYVQFMDGDCELVQGWMERAYQELEDQTEVAVVCGRRRERFPEISIYNQLCDLEWNTPVGEAKACGGDAMIRVVALQQVGGFNSRLIAGEEPELCLRLRQQGWKIFRVDHEMTIHDAQITSFTQWWKRTLRAGYAYTEGAWMHGRTQERHWVKESLSITFWALVIPIAIVILLLPTHGLALLLMLLYPLLGLKVYRSSKKQDFDHQQALLYAIFCILGKFPQVQGQIQFFWHKLQKQHQSLIEYKEKDSALAIRQEIRK